MNELTNPGKLDHGAIDFNALKNLDIIENLKTEISTANKKLADYETKSESDFDSVFNELFTIEESVDRVASIFYSLYEVDLTEERMKIAPEVSNLVTEFSSNISLNERIFNRVKKCFENKDQHNYTQEQNKIIENHYQDFIRNGALLSPEDKKRLKDIDNKLSTLRLKFNENTLKATNADVLHVTKEEDLAGLPNDLVEGAHAAAVEANKSGWIFTLHAPSYAPFMTYAKNRDLRKKFYLKRGKVAFGGEFDNRETIKETLALRFERARLLGYENHSHFVLDKRMAQNPSNVYQLLDRLKKSAEKSAKVEIDSLKSIMKDDIGSNELMAWDVNYYTEKHKMNVLKFNDEELKPYFKLENVLAGVFLVAEKMYDLTFKERTDLPVYHEEVKVFEVFDQSSKEFIGLFYTDYFPRKTKGSGAWCDQFQGQGFMFGKIRRPHVINVGNFNPSTKSQPSLLNFNEVLTLFHEFGHGLHSLLSKCHYRALSGTNVFWDFVELPSQIMENWCYQKECLDLFAKHYQTDELIPAELVEKLKKMSSFMQASKIYRQVKLAKLDMAFHDTDPKDVEKVEDFEHSVFKDFSLIPEVDGICMATNFGHLFGGGYSAGYYSYHWAEVLDADAFELFEEQGILNPVVARKFREEILEKGGTEDPSLLYRNFRGQDPNPDALLKRSGLN